MEWSGQQDAALKQVVAWAKDKKGDQVFRLFGFAGTGKTTMAKEIADRIGGNIPFAAFTGKAALMLQSKGCFNASTIHALIYKRNPLAGKYPGEPFFVKNPNSIVGESKLLIIDEVSMVGKDIGEDLLSFGTKILVIGDPEQLPPIRGEGFFTQAKPNVMLTEIHRQARENPIIRLSIDVREGKGLTPGNYGKAKIIRRDAIGKDELRSIILKSDQLLVGKNSTRRLFNHRIRELKKMEGDPKPGDRLVCLRNNHAIGILNGGIWSVAKSKPNPISIEMLIRNEDLGIRSSNLIPVDVHRYFFEGRESELEWKDRREYQEFDFGYALTVHKAQGSQWNKLVVFDESDVFREDAKRWTYTGLTRAAEEIVWVI